MLTTGNKQHRDDPSIFESGSFQCTVAFVTGSVG
jgi:hypothetical protein